MRINHHLRPTENRTTLKTFAPFYLPNQLEGHWLLERAGLQMITIRINDRRLIKIVCLDDDGLPVEEIIQEPSSLRFRAFLARILPRWAARMFGLTPFARMIKRHKLLSWPA